MSATRTRAYKSPAVDKVEVPMTPQNPTVRGPVVVATKGSEDSASARNIADLLAAKLGQHVEMVSVVEPVPQFGLPPETEYRAANLNAEALASRNAEIESLLPAARDRGTEWRASVRLGNMAREVSALARERNASLIVVGASPSRRNRRIISGQRAGRILHKASVPVLSAAPWMRALPTRVLAAIDFNTSSIHGAMVALSIMPPGASMTLLHVSMPSLIYPGLMSDNGALQEGLDESLQNVATFLKDYAPGVTIDQKILFGDPVGEILRVADSADYDLITMGTRSGSLARRVLVGSVATEIFHSAMCSVLACPPPPAQIVMEIESKLRGAAVSTERSEYVNTLHSFSDTYKGRTVSLEEDDSRIGTQLQVHGYVLNDVSYDAAGERVDIALSAPGSDVVNLTRTIPGVTDIAVAGAEPALQISNGTQLTLLVIE